MFKMRFAPLFNKFFTSTAQPVERVKQNGENPWFNHELIEIAHSNISGIAVTSGKSISVTPVYRTTVYCDVCELPVETFKAHGRTRLIEMQQFSQLTSDEALKNESGKSDATVINDKYSNVLRNSFNSQCTKCGRWSAKGRQHKECLTSNNLCKHCI